MDAEDSQRYAVNSLTLAREVAPTRQRIIASLPADAASQRATKPVTS